MTIQRIEIADLWCHAVIGIHDAEKNQTQPLGINLTLSFDASRAVASDTIADTVDYFTLAMQVKSCVEANHHELIEGLLEAVLDVIMLDNRILTAEVSICKPEALKAAFGAMVSLHSMRRRA